MRLKTVGMLIRTLVLCAVTTWEGCRGLAQVTVVRLQTMETASNTTYLDSGENALPDLPQWTLCVRLRLLHLARLNTLLSYTTGTFYQEILLGIEWPQSSLRLECCGYSGFMELKVPIRLFTWHHLCVSANMTGDSQHIVFDNVIHEALIRRPGITPAELNKVRGGGRFLVGQNYNPAAFYVVSESLHGDLADFRLYNVALSLKHLQEFVACESYVDLPSPLYSFDVNMSNFHLSGDILVYNMNLFDVCTPSTDVAMIVPERVDFDRAKAMCSYFTGGIVVPTNNEENEAIYDKFEDFNFHCADSWGTSFWFGLTANLTSGWWTKLSDGKPLTWHKFHLAWSKPVNEHRCVAAATFHYKYIWGASPCDLRQCPICNVTVIPRLHLRGLCKLSKFDRFYSPHNYYNRKPVFEGFFLSRIIWENDSWVIRSRLEKGVEAIMEMKKPEDYPFGVNTWQVRNDTCTKKQVELLLTSCGENDFTCSDGSCINKTKRCDYKVDCQDSTDELNCQAIVFPEGYPSELAPPAGDSEQMALYISIQITSIRKFDLAGFNLAIDVIQSIKWKDERLLLRNLRPGDFVNKARVIEKLWMPEILVSDGYYNPTDVKQHLVKLLIRRDSQSLPDDDTYYTEDDMYSGSGSTLKLVQQYTVTAMCLFLLHVYPFDSQICSLTFSLPDQSAGNLLLVQEGVAFTGKRMLLEYQLLNETLVSWNNLSTSMQLRLQFRNQYGYYIGNSVIPSLLMVSICYLTFFFAMEDFTDRIMVSLTSLLVLASLFTQTSQSIPKTAYLKLIDIWHVSLIITDFLIVVTLVVIENQRLVDKLQSDFNAPSALRNVKGITPVVACRLPARSHGMNNNLLVLHQRRCSAAMKYNRASQVMFPVLACAGTFGWILVHLYRSPSAPEH
ncbi:uncharacterized protein [Cherax quadricarinatus]|uniref:uncharacterized protein n=1 Tax=Cherax quadricarinatus TaxID=27406 RepID=UPI002378EB1B|nr:uncharacterized protein LOC128688573 [Cherax quadricarinatus]